MWVGSISSVLLAVLAMACSAPERMTPPARMGCGPMEPEVEADVREAALRYLLRVPCGRESTGTELASIVCVGTHDDSPTCAGIPCDPPATFVDRLGDLRPQVVPASDCTFGFHVKNGRTGELATAYSTGTLCLVAKATVDLEAKQYAGFGAEATFTLTLHNHAGKWDVDSCQITDVS